MKRLKNIFLVCTGAWALSACSSDFLDVTPEGQLTDGIYFAEETRINDAVSQVYSSLNWRFYRLGHMYFATHSLCSDDYVVGSNADFSAIQNFEYLSNNYMVERYWDRWYQYLNDCNVVTDMTKGKTSEVAVKAEAQAKYFRAYHYFDLVRVFGEVPLRDHVPSQAECDIPKSSEEDIYKQIISDLEYAITNLPTHAQWGEAGNGRVSKETAEGLLSIVYLTRQDYANALEHAEKVIASNAFSLYSDYRNLFAPWNNYSCENMMPGHYTYQNITGRTRNPYVEYQGIPSNEGYGSYCMLPSSNIVDVYETGDPRKTASIFTKGDKIEGLEEAGKTLTWKADYAADGRIYANRKVIWDYDKNGWNYAGWPNGDFFSQELNMPFMRYAEILLVAAEAANEQNDVSKAQGYLEQVRFRARGNKTYAEAGVLPQIVTSDKTELRHTIWNERRIELAFEGHRWFDLVRYEKVESGYTTLLMQKLGRSNFNYDKYNKFPLPETRVSSSQGILTQNPKW